jgi:proline iminopeptidase
MKTLLLFSVCALLFFSCSEKVQQETSHPNEMSLSEFFKPQSSGVQNGGVKVIPIETSKGKFNIWTKTIGNNPQKRVLLLNGGPGLTHEYFECFENFLPGEGIEIIYYDQLGCGNSDNPKDTTMWDLARYVEEVEQVRSALHLTKDNFYLLGHSWGGILALEYALKYQQNLKGLIISNMMCSCPDYGKYADEVLSKKMQPAVLDSIHAIEARGDFSNPKYMELLMPNFYQEHICRIPLAEWPEPINRSSAKINQSLYVTMQGPSEFGIAGNLERWDRKDRLKEIVVPTLTIGAKEDTMDPEHMKWMSTQVKNGSYHYCPNGSHMCFYDDQDIYFKGLIAFLKK